MRQTIKKNAQAGMAKKHDLIVLLEPAEPESGVAIEVKSSGLAKFQIETTVRSVLTEHELKDLIVKVEDEGALDFTVRARTETAVRRALKRGENNEFV
ncbi:MAG: citrate lyase acyl carrier protein [Sporomusaceae bacterium]|nr:citrate lyase acyl carrier protein [Sporomusaceae bacterium]